MLTFFSVFFTGLSIAPPSLSRLRRVATAGADIDQVHSFSAGVSMFDIDITPIHVVSLRFDLGITSLLRLVNPEAIALH